VKRLFILGPTGSDRKYYTKKLKESMSFNVIETGALLRKEIIKKSDLAQNISQAFFENRYGN
jgi:adenylate kinase family enzyme